MMKKLRLNSVVEKLPPTVPFVAPEMMERARGRTFRARLGANESAFGPSPSVVDAMAQAAKDSWMYGDPESLAIKTAIGDLLGIKRQNLVVGEGIDGLLSLIARLALQPDSVVVTSEGAYPTFNFFVAGQGARLVKVPYRKDREDLQALLDAAKREKASLLYVANPDNPMGSWWEASEIERLIEGLPDGVMLVLDEAYSDTAPAAALPPFDTDNRQVLRLRTFSKAYGLAGARVGYAVGEAEVIASFDKVRAHFGVNRVGQAGALAALEDQAYLTDVVSRIEMSRRRIASIAAEYGLEALTSATNFVAIDCMRDGQFAKSVLDALLARDVFVRMPGPVPLNRCIRVSCGPDEAIDVFAEALPEALKVARG